MTLLITSAQFFFFFQFKNTDWASVLCSAFLYLQFYCFSWGQFSLSSSLAQTQVHGLVIQHVGSSPMRNSVCVPCIGRWILNHWTSREVPQLRCFCLFLRISLFFFFYFFFCCCCFIFYIVFF